MCLTDKLGKVGMFWLWAERDELGRVLTKRTDHVIRQRSMIEQKAMYESYLMWELQCSRVTERKGSRYQSSPEMASDLYGFRSGIKPDLTQDIVDSSSTPDSLDRISFDCISTRVSHQWTWYQTQSDIDGISDCQT
jgi:hypothetical protein